ncbi:MAG TPA: 3'-5' exonuclease [Bacteroidales bacterium]|nr:3'-5' exonuclease [Bacteroidales bacterium]
MKKNNYRDDITGEELRDYPVGGYEGEITVVDNSEDLDVIIHDIIKSGIVGFDTETKPSFRKGDRNRVALLQLSNEKRVYLFRLHLMGLPDLLKRVLEDPGLLKVGVAIHDDVKGLKKLSSFKPAGFVELQELVGDYGIKSAGLRKLAAIILGFRISKRQQISNWESPVLTDAQISYAATDAWVCHQIYMELIRKR